MAVVVNNSFVTYLEGLVHGKTSYEAETVNLFVNLRQPLATDVFGNYVLCTLPGYTSFSLSGPQWSGAIVAPGVWYGQYPQITWVFDPYTSAQQTIFGYVVTGAAGDVHYAELFPAPFPVPPGGGELPLLLTWQDEQCPG